MKNLFKLWCLLIIIFLSSCHSIMYEKKLVVNKIKIGDNGYKYRYYINAIPVDQVLYSNEIYNVGDTIKICH